MHKALTYEQTGDLALLKMDDGRANALDPSLLRALQEALRRAEKEAQAVVLSGREDRFCAGFDLAVFRQGGPEAVRNMVAAGAELALQIARHPAPVVIACTGHALAMGAVLLCAADLRIGTAGDFKIGFNEVAIGMAAPRFLAEFARERLSKRHLQRAVVQAEIYTPKDALDAGFLDRVVAPEALAAVAQEAARRLAGLPRPAFLGTRKLLRGEVLDRIEATLAEDRTSSPLAPS